MHVGIPNILGSSMGGGGIGAAGTVTGQAVTWNGSIWTAGPTTILLGTTFLSIGPAPASAGDLRVHDRFRLAVRNDGDTADLVALDVGAGDALFVGGNSAFGAQFGTARLYFATIIYLGIGSTNYQILTASQNQLSQPMVGDDIASPYSLHGGVASLGGDANYTYTVAEYRYDYIDETAALTLGRTRTLPNPSSKARGYYKTIRNATGQTLTIQTGAATETAALPTGTTWRLWVEPDRVRRADA